MLKPIKQCITKRYFCVFVFVFACLCLRCLSVCFVEAVRESQSIGGDAGWCGRATEISNTWLCQHQGVFVCACNDLKVFIVTDEWIHISRRVMKVAVTKGPAHVFMWCVCGRTVNEVDIYIECVECMCNPRFVCAGESRANPVCAEFHWGWSSPADCSGRLSQPTHGESLCVLC